MRILQFNSLSVFAILSVIKGIRILLNGATFEHVFSCIHTGLNKRLSVCYKREVGNYKDFSKMQKCILIGKI